MNGGPAHSSNQSILIPDYRGILAVDAEGFTELSSIEHEVVVPLIQGILKSSLERAGLANIWKDRKFPQGRGDGYVFGFDPSKMPLVIDPWLRELQNVLSEDTASPIPIRLRVSLHIGPLPVNGVEHDGNGTPRNDTHRLLNADQLKTIMAAASPHVTRVAAILSGRCYEDAVLSGRTLHPDHFISVSATVRGKNFQQQAWIHLPAASGNLFDRRFIGEPGASDPPPPSASDTPSWQVREINKVTRGNLNSGVIHGDQAITYRD
ncbi:hypothetical protein [Nonomuraea fuscirosea]|uniref:hypothetical protein n=1 Tax=Nonomuraea fuscirosea TaxID=1291556 RepID=UPI0033CDF842